MRLAMNTDNEENRIAQATAGVPKVSVIIPVYNTEQYVAECLRSVTGQTLREIEILCVNDGSSDGTREILRDAAAKDPRITVVDLPHSGISAARNAGLGCARGEYVCFLDSDDFLDTGALEILTAEADEKDTDILFFDRTRFYEDESMKGRFPERMPRKGFEGVYSGTELMACLRKAGKYYHNVTMALFRRPFLRETGLRFHEKIIYVEDLLFMFLAMMKAKKASCCARTLYHYRIHEGSIMTGPGNTGKAESYALCIGELLRFGILDADTADQKAETAHELEKVRRIFENQCRKLDEAERNGIAVPDPLNAFLSDCLLAGMDEEELKRRYDALERSRSYRLGRAVTWLPRKLRRGVASLRRYRRRTAAGYEKEKEKSNVPFSKHTAGCGACQPRETADPPKVSVIIPAYNTERYVAQCLNSVMGQTLREIEIICVNDGSSDGTPQILHDAAVKDPRITVVDLPHGGPSAARNAGLDLARGEYIGFIDSDDLLDAGALEILASEADEKDTDILFLDKTRFFEERSMEAVASPPLPPRQGFDGIYTGTELLSRLRKERKNYHSVCLCFFRGAFLRESGLRFHEDILYAEDLLFTFLAMMKAKRASCCGKLLYHYRIRPNSIMTSPLIAEKITGYGICFRELLRFGVLEADLPGQKAETALELEKVRCLCVNDYRKLSKAERNRIAFSDPVAEFLFGCLLAGKDKEELKRRCDSLLRSRSYRLGRALTRMHRLSIERRP